MTPGILSIIALVIVLVGMGVVGFNFWTIWKHGDMGGKNMVLHIVGCAMCSMGMLALMFSGVWFLILQAKA